jgi:hypothetical protein
VTVKERGAKCRFSIDFYEEAVKEGGRQGRQGRQLQAKNL